MLEARAALRRQRRSRTAARRAPAQAAMPTARSRSTAASPVASRLTAAPAIRRASSSPRVRRRCGGSAVAARCPPGPAAGAARARGCSVRPSGPDRAQQLAVAFLGQLDQRKRLPRLRPLAQRDGLPHQQVGAVVARGLAERARRSCSARYRFSAASVAPRWRPGPRRVRSATPARHRRARAASLRRRPLRRKRVATCHQPHDVDARCDAHEHEQQRAPTREPRARASGPSAQLQRARDQQQQHAGQRDARRQHRRGRAAAWCRGR